MKKCGILLLALVLSFAILSPICGYAEQNTAPDLLEEVALAIKNAYADQYAKDGCQAEELTLRYFGEYDGCHVAFIDGGPFDYTPMEAQDMVGGFPFDYVNGQKLEVYKDGQFLTLTKAFEAGWLSEETVGRLWNYYTNGIYELPKTGDAVLLPALWMLLSSAAALPLLLKRRNRS